MPGSAVVILGAGSSADFGVPVLRAVFEDPSVADYLRSNAWLTGKIEEHFWGPRGHDPKSARDSLTIEEMLTLVRDWERSPELHVTVEPKFLQAFLNGLYVLVMRAVFEAKSSRGRHLNRLLAAFGETFERTTWATFNWDCIFEASYWYTFKNNPQVVVPLRGWRNGSSTPTLLKLHGSVGWWKVDHALRYFRFSGGGSESLTTQWTKFEQGDVAAGEPVILEPSFYKYGGPCYDLLKPQWERFQNDLRTADVVLVIGYSLPDADANARSHILTGFQFNRESNWAVLDPSDTTIGRWRSLLGLVRATYMQKGLAAFNENIAQNLACLFPKVSWQGLGTGDPRAVTGS